MSSFLWPSPTLVIWMAQSVMSFSSASVKYGVGPCLLLMGVFSLILSCSVEGGTPYCLEAALREISPHVTLLTAASTSSSFQALKVLLGMMKGTICKSNNQFIMKALLINRSLLIYMFFFLTKLISILLLACIINFMYTFLITCKSILIMNSIVIIFKPISSPS